MRRAVQVVASDLADQATWRYLSLLFPPFGEMGNDANPVCTEELSGCSRVVSS